jgi:hypothetical protein
MDFPNLGSFSSQFYTNFMLFLTYLFSKWNTHRDKYINLDHSLFMLSTSSKLAITYLTANEEDVMYPSQMDDVFNELIFNDQPLSFLSRLEVTSVSQGHSLSIEYAQILAEECSVPIPPKFFDEDNMTHDLLEDNVHFNLDPSSPRMEGFMNFSDLGLVVKKSPTQIDSFGQTRSHFADPLLTNISFDFSQKISMLQTPLSSSLITKKSSKPRGRPSKASKVKEEVDAGNQSTLDSNFPTSK